MPPKPGAPGITPELDKLKISDEEFEKLFKRGQHLYGKISSQLLAITYSRIKVNDTLQHRTIEDYEETCIALALAEQTTE